MRKRPNFVRAANPRGGPPSHHRNTVWFAAEPTDGGDGVGGCRPSGAADCGKSVVENRRRKLVLSSIEQVVHDLKTQNGISHLD